MDHEGEHWKSYLLSYARPYWGKSLAKLNHLEKLSPKAKVKYKAINLYRYGDYSLE